LCRLLVWHHLSWLGETLRGGDPRAAELLRRGGDFTLADRRSLLELIAEGVAAVIPRWRALTERGSVELSTTPYYHPLLPLLLDFSSACDTAPGPPCRGGRTRAARSARGHLQEGLARCEQLLGQRPTGCWPSEAALSEATLLLLAEAGFSWTASSQSVLNATAGHAGKSGTDPFRVYRRAGEATVCVFRDDGLSDGEGLRTRTGPQRARSAI
jgi:alpha-amylase/alpha-mannosidase (GH57 family)